MIASPFSIFIVCWKTFSRDKTLGTAEKPSPYHQNCSPTKLRTMCHLALTKTEIWNQRIDALFHGTCVPSIQFCTPKIWGCHPQILQITCHANTKPFIKPTCHTRPLQRFFSSKLMNYSKIQPNSWSTVQNKTNSIKYHCLMTIIIITQIMIKK